MMVGAKQHTRGRSRNIDGEDGQHALPKVFVSYSHADEAHRARVLRLADRLSRGAEVVIDQYFQFPPEGWPLRPKQGHWGAQSRSERENAPAGAARRKIMRNPNDEDYGEAADGISVTKLIDLKKIIVYDIFQISRYQL